jgi:hypothetical protein
MARSGFSADRELSKICTELWKLDENRLKPGVDYQINLQGGIKKYDILWCVHVKMMSMSEKE